MESTSGETYKPHHSRSSPVLTMTVSSFADTTCRRPSTNFAPPVPPVSTTIIEPSPVRSPLRPRLLSFCRPADRLSQSLLEYGRNGDAVHESPAAYPPDLLRSRRSQSAVPS